MVKVSGKALAANKFEANVSGAIPAAKPTAYSLSAHKRRHFTFPS